MFSILFLVLWGVLAAVCFCIKHSLFTVYYVGNGFVRELAQIAAISLFLTVLLIRFVVLHPFISLGLGVLAVVLTRAGKTQ